MPERIGCTAQDAAREPSRQTALGGSAAGCPAPCASGRAQAVFRRGQVPTRPADNLAADCAPHPVPGRRGRARLADVRLSQHRGQPLHGVRGANGGLRCSCRCP